MQVPCKYAVVIKDAKLAIKELLKSTDNTIVYHTSSDKIVIELRNPTGLRGLRL